MPTEFIKIERTIWKRSYGLETKDKLIQIYGEELGGYDLSPEFKEQLWEDMSIDIDELIGEFGDKEAIEEVGNMTKEDETEKEILRKVTVEVPFEGSMIEAVSKAGKLLYEQEKEDEIGVQMYSERKDDKVISTMTFKKIV